MNERLAKRGGMIGKFFNFYQMGERQMSQHSLLRIMKVVNWYWVYSY